jgi:non-specific protein-tyrosine kinase
MRCVCLFPETRESDSYNVVRTHIQNITQNNGWRTVMFTSTMPGEGKTLTCINLALSFAKSFNQTILLVDNDLKRQKIHQYLGIKNHVGLRDYLVKNRPLKDIIVWPGIPKFALISGGKTINASSELMSSPKMKSMVNETKTRYADRYVFFDTSPILGGADAMTFLQLVDCVVMVVEAEKTSTEDIQKSRSLIPDEKFAGFILNRQKAPARSYYGYYSA